ncbi:MAG: ABC transporter substrate-binding protein [Chloroflexota bacterium]
MRSLTRLSLLLLFSVLVLSACGPTAQETGSEGQLNADPTDAVSEEEPMDESPTEPPPTEAPPTEPPPTPTEAPPTATATPGTPSGMLDHTIAFGGTQAYLWEADNGTRYQEMHPDLVLSRRSTNLYSSPVPNTFYGYLESEDQADVYTSFIVGSLRDYVAEGAIADIGDLWDEMGWHDAFPESIREMVTFDGKQYFVPMALQWNPIWYRTDIFAEVGLEPPQTWEEFLAACDTLSEAGYIPVTVATSGWTPPVARWFSILNMRLNGPQFHEALMDGEESYDDPRVRAVFEHWAELIEHDCFPEGRTSYQDAATQIFDGEAAMYNLGEWLSESREDGLPQTLDFFSFPILNPDVPRGEIVHVYGSYMPVNAQHPIEARRFLAYLGAVESQTSNVETLGRVASNVNVDSSLYNDVYSRGLQFVQEADHITQLFEFNTHSAMAAEGLRLFVRFMGNPQEIDEVIEELEAARVRTFE